jgi:hypothetical protein
LPPKNGRCLRPRLLAGRPSACLSAPCCPCQFHRRRSQTRRRPDINPKNETRWQQPMRSRIPEKPRGRQADEIRRETAVVGDSTKRERRTSERCAYPLIQMLAPCHSSRPPDESEFRAVRCHDISRGGLSFFWPAPPDFEYLVVSLRGGTDTISLKARVVRSRAIADLENEFLVCCRFVTRVAQS